MEPGSTSPDTEAAKAIVSLLPGSGLADAIEKGDAKGIATELTLMGLGMMPQEFIASAFGKLGAKVINALSKGDNDLVKKSYTSGTFAPEGTLSDGVNKVGATVHDIIMGKIEKHGFDQPSHLMAPADAKKISEAEELQGKGFFSWFTGASKKEIFEKTGLVKGIDNKWRSFIDDRNVEWKFDPEEIELKKNYKLSDLIRHPALFNVVPEAKNIPVRFDDADGYGSGDYIDAAALFEYNRDPNDKSGDQIRIGRLAAEHPGKYLGSLLHEVQHYMQRNGGFFKFSDYFPKTTTTDDKEAESVDVAKTFAAGKAIPDDVLESLGIDPSTFKAPRAYIQDPFKDEKKTTDDPKAEDIPMPTRNPRRKRK